MKQEMWQWIIEILNRVCGNADVISVKKYADVDDVRSEVYLILLNNPKIAEKIYEEKNIAYLRKLVKRAIYEINSGMHCSNKMYFYRIQKIQEVCQKYHIPMKEENAYKISYVMQYENYSREEYGIKHVSKLLSDWRETDIPLLRVGEIYNESSLSEI